MPITSPSDADSRSASQEICPSISQFLEFAHRIVYETDRKVSEYQAVDTARKSGNTERDMSSSERFSLS